MTGTSEKVNFELVSPEKIVLAQRADMVVLPAAEGALGVLPRHAPMIAALQPGVIRVHDADKVVEQIFVAGGFAEIAPDRLTVLAEEAQMLATLSREDIDSRIRQARDEIEGASGDFELAEATERMAVAQAMRRAIDGLG